MYNEKENQSTKRKALIARVAIDEEELMAIFEKMDRAKETIWECYEQLKRSGLIVLSKNNVRKEDANDA